MLAIQPPAFRSYRRAEEALSPAWGVTTFHRPELNTDIDNHPLTLKLISDILNMASKLQTLLAQANAEATELYDKAKRAEGAGLAEAKKPLMKKFLAASHARDKLESLLNSSEDQMTRQMARAASKRESAATHKASDPGLAKAELREAAGIEARYRLWCDHHGTAPKSVVALAKPKQVVSPALPVKSGGRGGKRRGAGRPALGHVQLLFKCTPKTAQKVRRLVVVSGGTLGEWLDGVVALMPGAR